MSESVITRLATQLGALALGLADAQRAAVEANVGQTGEAAAALVAISAFPGERVTFFEPILGLTSAGTVRLIGRLEAHGWVERRPGRDARSYALFLTDAGRELTARLQAARQAVLQTALQALDATAREHLEAALPALLAALPGDRSAARRMCRLCDHAVCDGAGACPVDAAVTAAGHPPWPGPPL
jgi:DNA-binding MarR family transcriptional regulator